MCKSIKKQKRLLTFKTNESYKKLKQHINTISIQKTQEQS